MIAANFAAYAAQIAAEGATAVHRTQGRIVRRLGGDYSGAGRQSPA